MKWYVQAPGIERPVGFDTEADARAWATENLPNGGYFLVEQDESTGRFEDVPELPKGP